MSVSSLSRKLERVGAGIQNQLKLVSSQSQSHQQPGVFRLEAQCPGALYAARKRTLTTTNPQPEAKGKWIEAISNRGEGWPDSLQLALSLPLRQTSLRRRLYSFLLFNPALALLYNLRVHNVTDEVSKEEVPVSTEAATTETPAPPATEAVPEVNAPEPTAAVPEPTAETTEATATTDAAPANEAAPAEAAPESPKPKSPGLFSKLLAPFKGEKKPKAPKSPKKEKKKEEVEAAPAATEEAPKPEEVPVKEEAPVADAAPEEPKESAHNEPVAEAASEPVVAVTPPEEATKTTENPAEEVAPAPAADAPKAEEKKTEEKKPSKAGRRLSARVTGFFKPKHKPEETSPLPAKVDENPPKIDEPTPVAPLENPTEEAKTTEVAPDATEEAKPESSTTPAPQVAATA
ncbi:hypothetical protein OPQ81_006603 [Rhizoctonia solani]|nr:hypothetical protein OPQ81_006603 [Rhizoctonia solani]